RYLQTISDASEEMGNLIDDLLAFSQVGRTDIMSTAVDLDALVADVIHRLEMDIGARTIVWQVAPLPRVLGDPALLKQVLANLIGNAIKYTRMRDPATIAIGATGDEGDRVVL